jgi:hypothetical protein
MREDDRCYFQDYTNEEFLPLTTITLVILIKKFSHIVKIQKLERRKSEFIFTV